MPDKGYNLLILPESRGISLNIMKIKASSYLASKAITPAMQPEKRFRQVTVLGMWRVIAFAIIVSYFNLAITVWLPVVNCPMLTQISVPNGRYTSTREPNFMNPKCSSI